MKNNTDPITSFSGHAMDQKVIKNKKSIFFKILISIGVAVFLIGTYILISPFGGKTLYLDGSHVNISEVRLGKFEEYIVFRGRIIPSRTVYLDAVEGGRVESLYVEDGEFVDSGQLLVELSNTRIQLDIISREAQVTEQLNNLRTQQLKLEQNKFSHKRTLIEINYKLKELSRLVKRYKTLTTKDSLSLAEYESAMDEYDYYIKLRDITLESQKSDEILQNQQLIQLEESTINLKKNLIVARRSLESLIVKAPVSGKLTAFDIEVGQSIKVNERLGRIDDPNDFKISAQIDEFYLREVDEGQIANIIIDEDHFNLRVSKVYPQVANGEFEVSLVFQGKIPDGIKRGQTINGKLFLSDAEENVLLISNGNFYSDTGGNWVYVVSDGYKNAVKRNVSLGRKNSQVIEVLEGLELKEKIITSSYSSFNNMDRLIFN